MAKSKNHSSHHKNRKDHRNGIKKASTAHYQISQAKLDPRYLKNLRYVRKKQLAEYIQRKRCKISYFREEYRKSVQVRAERIEREKKKRVKRIKKAIKAGKSKPEKPAKPTDAKKPVKRLKKPKRVPMRSWDKLYY